MTTPTNDNIRIIETVAGQRGTCSGCQRKLWSQRQMPVRGVGWLCSACCWRAAPEVAAAVWPAWARHKRSEVR